MLGEDFRVKAEEGLISEIEELLGSGVVDFKN
jgi:hypothetical protein